MSNFPWVTGTQRDGDGQEKAAEGPNTSSPRVSSVTAVVVTMNPDAEHIKELLKAMTRQVGHVVVVDNGSNASVRAVLEQWGSNKQVSVVPLESNMGIAMAQNTGIRIAMAAGAQYILLSDHDSLPFDGMVSELVRGHQTLSTRGPVAAVGPVTVDCRTGVPSKFVRLTRLGVRRFGCENGPFVQADFLIASGCLISADAVRQVGEMSEDYFIDHVDTEWCLRAKSRGWGIYGVCSARLHHALGDRVIRVWAGRWRDVPVHSPIRDYYMFRNTIFLLKSEATSLGWALTHLYRIAQFLFFFGLFVPPRRDRWALMAKGLWHGIAGKGGKL